MLKDALTKRFAPTKTYLYNGEQQTVSEIAKQNGLVPSVLHKRLKRCGDDLAASLEGDFSRNQPIDMAGQKYGRLTVIEMAGRNKHNQRMWRCVCDCGGESEVVGQMLRTGMTKSCGCLKREAIASLNRSHGMSGEAIYSIWHSMMDRCHLPTSHAFSRYGGRGIAVCDRWHDFENFYADMGDKPEGMSLERTDNDGPYSPENVRWASIKEQANNRRSSRWIEFRGERKTLAQWCDELGLKVGTVWARLNRDGFTVEAAFTKPIGRWV